MEEHTQTLLVELTRRWLALGVETQELVVMTTRLFSLDREKAGTEGLPHYQEALERQDKAMAKKYTTFGQLAVGDRFTWFGQGYQRIEPMQVSCWVNCQSDRGQTFMGDDFVVGKREESQDTLDRTV